MQENTMLQLPALLTYETLVNHKHKQVKIQQSILTLKKQKFLKANACYEKMQGEEQQVRELLEMVAPELSLIEQDKNTLFQKDFILSFMIIKLNSFLAEQCILVSEEFLKAFQDVINCFQKLTIIKCKRQEQFFSQLLLQTGLYKYLLLRNVNNILAGQCMLAVSCTLILANAEKFMQKAQITYALSFLALSGRYQAFIPNVHEEKNHAGQIHFAKTIYEYIKLQEPEKRQRIEVQSRRVQDPYSMRCAAQAYGVVYECMNHLKESLKQQINKFHFKTINIDGKNIPNLDLYSDNAVLNCDYLICSLNQVGSMSFLRCQRILNFYLGKNQCHKQNPKRVFELKALMERTIYCVSDNKILATPSNIDTMNLENYEKDVFYTGVKVHEKFCPILANLYKIMTLEVQTAILGLTNVYKLETQEDIQLFQNLTIRKHFLTLAEKVQNHPKNVVEKFVCKEWLIEID